MKIGRLVGWGIVIYAVMYLLVAILSIYGLYSSIASRVLALAVLITVSTIAGHSLRPVSIMDILPYSFFWMLEVAALDALVSVPYAGWHIYLNWNVWVGYLLVLFVPLFSVLKHRAKAFNSEL